MLMATQIKGAVLVGGTGTFMARITGHEDEAITRADIEAVEYSLFLIQNQARTAVAGHQAVALTVADVMLEALSTAAPWTKDEVGRNFQHILPITENPAFAEPLSKYILAYTLTPATGEPIAVDFDLNTLQ